MRLNSIFQTNGRKVNMYSVNNFFSIKGENSYTRLANGKVSTYTTNDNLTNYNIKGYIIINYAKQTTN